jgi:hypothetical protein
VDGEVKGQLAELVYWSGTLAIEVPKAKGNTIQEVRFRSVWSLLSVKLRYSRYFVPALASTKCSLPLNFRYDL